MTSISLIEDFEDEQAFKSLAPAYGINHCVMHGVFDSFLLFAKAKESADDDGLLEARETMSLKLNADLVVLSYRNTARGRIGVGDGVIGLPWALFAAGHRSTPIGQRGRCSVGAADASRAASCHPARRPIH